ncbi:hypothetical protein MPSEU_000043400 [Mayamaea pseudoterrestris]|nr:hypothetical protein MPSEU_000043400 [Mayamaea pseudoterrestris]
MSQAKNFGASTPAAAAATYAPRTDIHPSAAASAEQQQGKVTAESHELEASRYTKTLDELKAEARAIALSSTVTKKKPPAFRQLAYQQQQRYQRRRINVKPSAAQVAATIHAQNAKAKQDARLAQNGKGPTTMQVLQQRLPLSTTPKMGQKRRLSPSMHEFGETMGMQITQQSTNSGAFDERQQPANSMLKSKKRYCQPWSALLNDTQPGLNDNATVNSFPAIQFDADYALFVKNLVATQGKKYSSDGDESVLAALALADDDDDDEFLFDDDEGEFDDDEDDDENDEEQSNSADDAPGNVNRFINSGSPKFNHCDASGDNDSNDDEPIDPVLEWESSIQEELEGLHQEDMQAAVATLLENPMDKTRRRHQSQHLLASNSVEHTRTGGHLEVLLKSSTKALVAADGTIPSPVNAGAAANVNKIVEQSLIFPPAASSVEPSMQYLTSVPTEISTDEQLQRFQSLLKRHYQILVQQAVLTVRTAHDFEQRHKKKSSDEDLQQRPENALLTEQDVVFSNEHSSEFTNILDSTVQMLQDLDQNRKDAIRRAVLPSGGARRLTRAQFLAKTQLLQEQAQTLTVFAIPGLHKLKDTFALLDNSAVDTEADDGLFKYSKHADACERVLKEAGAVCEPICLPNVKDVSEYFTNAQEFLGKDFQPPCNPAQETMLRRHRNLLTAAEDSLILRGVNLFGEKQWEMVRDRFLPDRIGTVISRRYNKLSVIVFRAFGVQIDEEGDLPLVATVYKSVEQMSSSTRQQLRLLKSVDAPAIYNVHRWDFEEDVVLLKGVALLGTSWAVIKATYLPHRDRTHIRKRYEVLARRFKSVEKVFHRDVQLYDQWMAKRQVELPPPDLGAVGLAAQILRKAKTDAMIMSPSGFSNAESEVSETDMPIRGSRLFGRDSFTSPLRFARKPVQGVASPLHTVANLAATINTEVDSSRSIFEKIAMDQNSFSALDNIDTIGMSNLASLASPMAATSLKPGSQFASDMLRSPAYDASRTSFGEIPTMSILLSPGVYSSRTAVEQLVSDRSTRDALAENGDRLNDEDDPNLNNVEEEGLSNESFASGLGLDMNESNGISFLCLNQSDPKPLSPPKQASQLAHDQPRRLFAGILDQGNKSQITNQSLRPLKKRATSQSFSFSSPPKARVSSLMEPPPTFGSPSALRTYQSIQPCDIGTTLGSFAAHSNVNPQLPPHMFGSVMHSPGLRTPVRLQHSNLYAASSGSTPRSLFSPDDQDAMDAISALGQLSQTPPLKEGWADSATTGRPSGQNMVINSSKKRKSLFQRVVGESDEKSSARKR